MGLERLRPLQGARRRRKRVGRGIGSGNGKTAGRGHKGQKSRSGGNVRPGFEGGQMPLQRQLPKRGFTNIFRKRFAIVNMGQLSTLPAQTQVNTSLLEAKGFIKGKRDGVKVLGNGEVSVALTVEADSFSVSARRKIEAAGGQAVVSHS